MSLKFGGGKTKSTSTSTESFDRSGTSNTNVTLPDWLRGPVEGLVGRIDGFSSIDPQSLVAGPSGLQTQAFGAAEGLLSNSPWQGLLGGAAGLAAQAGTAGANTAPVTLGSTAALPPASTAGMPQMGPVALAQGASAGAGSAGGASAQAGQIASTQGYSATTVDPNALKVGPMAQAGSASLLDGLDRYMSPYTQSVVDASAADLAEQQAQQRATLLGSQGKRNAFGGSGIAVENTLLGSQQTRDRNTILSGLRDQAFTRGAALSESDAGRRQQTGLFNTEQTNLGLLKDADTGLAGTLANQAATNQASEFGANAFNERGIAQGGLDTQASIASARNATDASIATLDAQTRASIATADNATRVALQNAQSVNDQASLLASLGVDVSKFNSDQINSMARFAASEQNDQTAQNVDALNTGARFDAGQQDAALNRGLTAAGLLGDIGNNAGANTRADLGLLGDLGGVQRGITQEGLLAGLNLTQAQADLLAPFLAQLAGQTQTTSETGTSTGTTKSKGTSLTGGVGFTYGDKG